MPEAAPAQANGLERLGRRDIKFAPHNQRPEEEIYVHPRYLYPLPSNLPPLTPQSDMAWWHLANIQSNMGLAYPASWGVLAPPRHSTNRTRLRRALCWSAPWRWGSTTDAAVQEFQARIEFSHP